jgi:hypothetical protein
MEDFDSLNEKQLESLERGLSDLKNNRVMTSNKFWKELLSNKEQQLLIDEAYEHYCKEYENGTHRIGTGLLWMAKETKDTFVYRSKADSDFSEKWGLTIEERELNYEERIKLFKEKTNRSLTYTLNVRERLDENGIPTKLITITYNDKTIESYE